MRPSILDPLFAPLESLPGIGPKLARLLDRLLARPDRNRPGRIVDLLLHLPTGAIDRTVSPEIVRAAEGAVATIRARVDRHVAPPNARAPYKVMVQDETGELTLVFFRGRREYLERVLPVGEMRTVSGTVEWSFGRPQMVHPDYVASDAELSDLPKVEPTYALVEGLTRKVLRKAVTNALARVPDLPEWLNDAVVAKRTFPSFAEALREVHDPAEPGRVGPLSPANARLACDELFAGQVALALVRQRMKRKRGVARRFDGSVGARIRAALPFEPTAGQERAVAEITSDMASPQRMLRLLQGDVGSGKTVVALLAAGAAAEAGGQTAFMAPTEVLARQHLATMAPLCEAAGLKIAILTGREKGAARQAVHDGLRNGEIDILVGTHALFQGDVAFHDLALAIVDEQHRFGVQQRLMLSDKGRGTDILTMTATPIPRTLVMTYFGDMDVSKLTEKPAGRQKIVTSALPLTRLDELVARIEAAIARGEKAYWICPLVEQNEELDLSSAQERFTQLHARLGDAVGLVHGRLSSQEKDAAMDAFKGGRTRVLVATTVVEVGVDVPDAGIIVIEHAERFGLSQLHQLRGRVGRGSSASTCILLYRPPLGETAEARLNVMRETDDGFVIAEEDLRLRGEGEILGTRQAGTPGFRVADLDVHADLLELARDDARLFLTKDPELKTDRGEAVRIALYLFGQDAAVRLLGSG